MGLIAVLLAVSPLSRAENRWTLTDDGGIRWQVDERLPHEDHIEMSGRRVSVVIRYGVKADGSLMLNKSMVWPMLRTIPNNTHASLMRRFEWDAASDILVQGRRTKGERVEYIALNHGQMTIESLLPETGLRLTRTLFPSPALPMLVEHYCLRNEGKRDVLVEIPAVRTVYDTPAEQGVNGSYTLLCKTEAPERSTLLKPGEHIEFAACIQAYSKAKGEKEWPLDEESERGNRRALADNLRQNLVLETPDEVVNRMFDFAKLRASESIYQTAGGPMHGPGGESYYAAIWANDQAEYVNPFFPFEGYEYGCQSALNSFRHFARYMNEGWKPIPSSIIAEGTDIWNGAGDRGDAAMIAYGAARYLLARASRQQAEQLWPLVRWCLEYCRRQLLPEGVVASDHDELEGRFPAGRANLCTSSLYYDALLSAAHLCREMKVPAREADTYRRQAADLRRAMEAYFGASVEGFETYRYYEGNDVLRSWICIPLCMGITERAKGTIEALFSPRLWTENGMLTQAGSQTFWDRSTLYALRGVYAAGEPDKATEFLHFYSNTRLLGEHVPYAIEAWPEGSQRHLSAESGLYARIITEGLFGIRPTGFHSFDLTPQMPAAWNQMALRRIRAFGTCFDIRAERIPAGKIRITITDGNRKSKTYKVRAGQTVRHAF
ncbi:MAG: hypothetical protein K5945_09200 [Bacteroidaceae bacterium]|nr:hypothetical protein [Bacteroidaceae bacterium]